VQQKRNLDKINSAITSGNFSGEHWRTGWKDRSQVFFLALHGPEGCLELLSQSTSYLLVSKHIIKLTSSTVEKRGLSNGDF